MNEALFIIKGVVLFLPTVFMVVLLKTSSIEYAINLAIKQHRLKLMHGEPAFPLEKFIKLRIYTSYIVFYIGYVILAKLVLAL